jgi:lipoprotein-anchoring transpeptidase ErfK/SrfK
MVPGDVKAPASTDAGPIMLLSRRTFLTSAAASLSLPAIRAFAEEEPFPVKDTDAKEIEYKYRRREVDFESSEAPGTIIVDPKKRYLYQVYGSGKAMRYGAAVGKAGRTWSGAATIGRKEKWPTWTPTPEHLAEFPKLEKWKNGMPGGPDNPMGARALYLYQGEVDTIYRIHGTHDPKLVGKKKTAGCFGLLNSDIVHLYDRVELGTKVVVLAY